MLIETPRLLIRALKASDLPDFTKILADPEVMRFSFNGLPLSQKQVEKLLSEYLNDTEKHGFGVCALILKDQNTFIGYSGLEWHIFEKEKSPSN